jgi:TetR/AcrR family transcriptional regulator, transcriptional repressor for nem operon
LKNDRINRGMRLIALSCASIFSCSFSPRRSGALGVGAICEFGSTDPDITARRSRVSAALNSRLVERLKEGQAAGEIDRSLDCVTVASFIQMTMQSIQLAARGGIDAASLRAQARFVVERLKSR